MIALFEQARAERSFEPLSGLLDARDLEGERFVDVRKYLLFGRKQTRWPGASRCLERALTPHAIEEIELDKSLTALLDALHTRSTAVETEAFGAFIEPGRGLPEWMHDEEAPALLDSANAAALAALLDRFKTTAKLNESDYLSHYVAALTQLIERLQPDEVLAISS